MFPFSPKNSAVPFCVSLPILHTQDESGCMQGIQKILSGSLSPSLYCRPSEEPRTRNMQNCFCTHLLAVRRTVVPVEHNNEAKDNIKEGGTNNQRAQELDRTRNQRLELPQKDKRLRKKKRYSDGEDMYPKTYTSEDVFFFRFILDIKFVGRTSRGHTGGRSHRVFHPPSFCGACLIFFREKDSAIPFPRRP